MRVGLILAGIVGVMVGLGFVCPAIAHQRMNGALMAHQLVFLVGGVLVTMAGCGGIARGIWPGGAGGAEPR